MTEYSYNAVLYYMQNAILYQTNNTPDSMPRRLYKSQSVLKEKSAFSFLRQLSTRHCPHVLLSAVLRPSAAMLLLPVNICGPHGTQQHCWHRRQTDRQMLDYVSSVKTTAKTVDINAPSQWVTGWHLPPPHPHHCQISSLKPGTRHCVSPST